MPPVGQAKVSCSFTNQQKTRLPLQVLIQEFRRGGGWTRGGKRGWVREGDVPPPARSAEVFLLVVDILCMIKCFL